MKFFLGKVRRTGDDMRVLSIDVYAIGQAGHAADVIGDIRREEIAYRTARTTLDNAGIQGCIRRPHKAA